MVNLSAMFLLFIEPTSTDENAPIYDALTDLMEQALSDAVTGTSNYDEECNSPTDIQFYEGNAYRGCQSTPNGKAGSNKESLLKNGLITNGCAVEYIRSYRNAIPTSEIEKLKSLAQVYGVEINWNDAFPMNQPVATAPAQIRGVNIFNTDDLDDLESDF